ncbi:MAG: FtsK/SpoIIIE domain-containing protein [Mycobacteriales bacterium]
MELGLGLAVPATGARADVVVRAPDGITLAQVRDQLLAVVIATPSEHRLSVQGVPLPPDALLGRPPLVEGALLEVDAPAPPRAVPGAPELHVVGGPSAGTVHLLTNGQLVVGRTGAVALDDRDVSREHCRLTLAAEGATVEDLGSTNGSYIDGMPVTSPTPLPYDSLLRVGSSTLALRRPAEPAVPLTVTGDGLLAYNRPPRLRAPHDVVQVVVPAPPAERERSPIPVLAVLAPLVLGVVMWRVLGNASFLLFTLLSPIMVIGNVVTERRAGSRQTRRQRALWRAQRDVAERTLADAVREDERRRRDASPDPGALLLTALGPRARLWERRRDDADALDLRVGLADQLAAVEAEGDVPDGATTARAVPVLVPLREAGVLGLAGEQAQALARAVVVQAAVLHSPRDLQLVVVAEPAAAAAWEWTRWLPHTAPEGRQECRATLGLGTAQAAARVAELSALVEARRSSRELGRPVLLVVDGARALRQVPGLATLLAEGPAVGVFTIAVEQDAQLLPEECSATAVATGATLQVRVSDRPDLADVPADLVSVAYTERVARALAPVRDSSRDRTSGLPESVRWTEVADLPLSGTDADAALVLERWAAPGRTTTAVLGRGPDGVFAVDIARDGPHALVAGTTGAGKSELLQTLVASLATGNRPDELHLLFVDYKGGAAFGPCVRLPHTVGMVTDLDGALVERALASLTAELKRREGLLAAAGAKDIDDHRRARGQLARLVIVVDEFASLAAELPDFVGGLVGIAQRGRSLGVHLVLATQRPEGVVSADIRANTNLRLCLAVTRETESRDVIDAPDAATISRTTPGRAYARTGHAELTPFQSGRVGGRRPAVVARDEAPVVTLVPAADLGDPLPRTVEGEEDVTDLSLLVDACRAANARLGLPGQRSPWLAPLPPLVTVDGIGDGLVLGLCDVPEQQARRPLVLDLEHGTHLLVVGSPRSGRTTALRTLAGALARSASADDVHLYAIDPGGSGLAALAALPHAGAVVPRDQPERIDRVLSYLAGEVVRRQALLGSRSLTEQRAQAAPAERLPHLLLLVDRWEAFLSAFQDLDAGRLVDLFYRLLREGPAAGLHVVLTSDRSGLVGRVSSMIEDRVLLRLADKGDYAAAGLPTRLVPDDLPAGRGWAMVGAPLVTQLALLDADPSGPAQTAALQRLAAAAAPPVHCRPRRVEQLPAQVPYNGALGVAGDELLPVQADLSDGGFLVAGPPRSGRSSTLLTIARGLTLPVVAVAPRPSPLRQLPGCHTEREAPDELEALLANGPYALLVDDAELLVDSLLAPVLERAVREARDTGSVVIAAGTTDELVTGYRGFVVDLRRTKSGLLLSPQSPGDGDLLGVRLSRSVGGQVQAGRCLLVQRGRVEPVQVALPD